MNETVYLVDDIIDMRTFKRKKQFLIKWSGFEDPSWEDEKLLRDSPDFIPFLDKYIAEIESGSKTVLKHSKNKRNVKGKIK